MIIIVQLCIFLVNIHISLFIVIIIHLVIIHFSVFKIIIHMYFFFVGAFMYQSFFRAPRPKTTFMLQVLCSRDCVRPPVFAFQWNCLQVNSCKWSHCSGSQLTCILDHYTVPIEVYWSSWVAYSILLKLFKYVIYLN